MKKALLGIAAAIVALIATPAMSADMPVKAARAPIVSPEPNWTGIYGGVSVGWARSTYNWQYTNPAPATCCAPFSATSDDGVFGFHAGAQYEFSHILIGVEGGINELGSKFATGSAPACVFPNSSTIVCQARTQESTTFGGRIGLAWTNWLFYGDGGWAHSAVQSQLSAPGAPAFDTTSAGYNGTYAGGGVEYMVFSQGAAFVTLGAEYQHISLGTSLHLSPLDGFGPCPPGVNCRNIRATEDIVRVRISVGFNPWMWARN